MESRGVFRAQLEGKALSLGLGPLVVYVVEGRATGVPTCHMFGFKTPARLRGRTFPGERIGQLRD